MKIKDKIKLYYYKKKVKKYSEDLCYHMTSVYDYLHSNNTTVQAGDLEKEAISLIGSWDRVSQNLFKHKHLGISIEIKKQANLQEITAQILKIEIDDMTKNLPGELVTILQREADMILDKNFTERQAG